MKPPFYKRLLKYFAKAIVGLFILIATYLAIACLLSFIGTNPKPVSCAAQQHIYITSNGLHLNFILPVDSIEQKLLTKLQVPNGVEYLSFGWGDKKFYLETPTWDDLRWGTTLRALLWKTDGAMHLTHYSRRSDDWTRVNLCPSQYEQLTSYIQRTFKENSKGAFIKIPNAGYTDRDAFYEAKGHYSAFYTCNNWVNAGLKRAAVKTSIWSPFDFGVLHHLRTP